MPGNSFGKLFRFSTWGESHGAALGCVIEGVPSKITLSEKDIQPWLNKRRPGKSRYTSQRKEPDKVKILSGVFEGKTTGSPISLQILNVDAKPKDYTEISQVFRPGHADYTYHKKYGIRDYRGSGRASARETAMRVAAGAVARKVLGKKIKIRGAVIQIGPHKIERSRWSWESRELGESREASSGWGCAQAVSRRDEIARLHRRRPQPRARRPPLHNIVLSRSVLRHNRRLPALCCAGGRRLVGEQPQLP